MPSNPANRTPDGRHQGSCAAVWIILAAWSQVAGWLLSAAGFLNTAGYALAGSVLAIALWLLRDLLPDAGDLLRMANRWKHRRRRRLPMFYLVVFGLVLSGAALYWPNNYDSVTYRIPRVLHWWSEGRWHWIGDVNRRMDFSGTGIEWMQLPVMILTRTDRWLYLLNFLPSLLIPGLVFSVFRGLGISSRAAWNWMWLLPLGFCFVLESGSTSNDTIAAVSLLASLHFSLRAVRTRSTSDLILSVLAAALTTSFKASNLPLMLPCVILLWPALKTVRPSWKAVLAGSTLGLLMSFAPMALLNAKHAGHWGGDPDNSTHHQAITASAGFIGNVLQGAIQNLAPPVLPTPRRVESLAMSLLPDPLKMRLRAEFPRFSLKLNELSQEESAGLGLPLVLMVIAATGAAARNCASWSVNLRGRRNGMLVGMGAWIAALVFMAKMGSESTGRLMAPYYALMLVPVLLCGSPGRWYRGALFRSLVWVAGLSAVMVVTLTPSRPLWPALTVLDRMPDSELVARARNVYQTYRERHDLLGRIRSHLPQEAVVIGWAADVDDSELGMWRPFGARKLIPFTPSLARSQPKDIPFDWIVVKASRVDGTSLEEKVDLKRLREGGFELVARESITFKASVGPEDWLLLRRSGR